MEYKLKDPNTCEALIRDLFLKLRKSVNFWASITDQTPQARMGYIGQHLVSAVTGYHGDKTGARGYDLLIKTDANGDVVEYGEIKTCTKVDQLGTCANCGAHVSSTETECSKCHSKNLIRKDDSKWLIPVRNEKDLLKVLAPKFYFFVLFEFADISKADSDIVITIERVNPKTLGFALCMIDYYYNIKSKSQGAPFNMWPHALKYELTSPVKIYQARISANDEITTDLFDPDAQEPEPLDDLTTFGRSTNLSYDDLKDVIAALSPEKAHEIYDKEAQLALLQIMKERHTISDSDLKVAIAKAIYQKRIDADYDKLSDEIKEFVNQIDSK
jgi:ribosomal protein L40E